MILGNNTNPKKNKNGLSACFAKPIFIFCLLTCVLGLIIFAPLLLQAASRTINWTSTSDFENNTSTTGQATTRDNLEVTDSGDVRLTQNGSGANLILLWDDKDVSGNPVTLPAGWTVVSNSGGPFYQKFIRGAASYSAASGQGALTHIHPSFSGTTGTSNSNYTYNYTSSGSTGAMNFSGHTHSISGSVASASNLPLYKNLKVIKYSGIPATIPKGAIALFDSAIPSEWTQYNNENGYFVRGEDTSNIGTTGGSNTHTHSASATTSTAGSNSYGGLTGGSFASVHSHTASGSSNSASSVPPYIAVMLAKVNNDNTAYPVGLIGMFDGSPSAVWSVASNSSGKPFYQRFLKAEATYGASSDTSTHNHPLSLTTGGPSGTNFVPYNTYSFTNTYASSSHGHSYGGTISNNTATSLPPYIDVVIAKKVSSYVQSGTLGGTGTGVGLRYDSGAGNATRWSSINPVIDGNPATPEIDALSSGQAIKFLIRVGDSPDSSTWEIYGRDGNIVTDINAGFSSNCFGQAFGGSLYTTPTTALPLTRYAEAIVKLEGNGTNTPALKELSFNVNNLPEAPTGQNVTSVDKNSMSLIWTDMATDEGAYYVEKSTDGLNFSQVAVLPPDSTSYDSTSNPTDIYSANTRYWFRIKCSNLNGSSDYAYAAPRYTLADKATSVTTFQADSDTVEISWQSPAAGTASGYRVYSSLDGYASAIYEGTSLLTVQSGLLPDSSYTYHIYSLNGDGLPSNEYAVGLATIPQAPSNLQVSSIGKTSADLTWTDTNVDFASNESAYIVEKSTDGLTYDQVTILPADSNAYSVNLLSPNTKYWFRVKALNMYGSSAYAATNSFVYTLADKPSLAGASVVGSDSIKVEWQDYLNGILPRYRLYSNSGGSYHLIYTGPLTGYTESGLSQGTTYTYRIYSLNEDDIESTDYATASATINVGTSTNVTTWTSKNDFTNNASTTNEETTVENLDVTEGGDVKLFPAIPIDSDAGADGDLIIDGTSATGSTLNGYLINGGPFNSTNPYNIDTKIPRSSKIYKFNSITLRNGAVLTHSSQTTSDFSIHELRVKETVSIDSSSRIDLTGKGSSGGTSGSSGQGFGGGSNGERDGNGADGAGGGGGGGYGGAGGKGSSGYKGFPIVYTYAGGAGGNAYTQVPFIGSGGGGGGTIYIYGGSRGGAGGGAIRIQAKDFNLNGQIIANGANGYSDTYGGGGGGGSAGAIEIISLSGTVNASNLIANGGNGGNGGSYGGNSGCGGGGAGGRVAVVGVTTGSASRNGGTKGSYIGNGENGGTGTYTNSQHSSYLTSGSIGKSGTTVGLKVDSGVDKARWSSVTSTYNTLSSGQAIKFLIRLSDDGQNWTVYGRDGSEVTDLEQGFESNYFGRVYTDVSAYTIPASSLPLTRYAEVLVRLEGNGSSTPVLKDVSLLNSGVPLAPSNIESVVEKNAVNLNWVDNASNETAYVVEKSTDGTTYNQIDYLLANTTNYRADLLTPNTRYWFRVKAINSNGSSTYASAAPKYTLADKPASATALAVGIDSIQVDWQPPANGTASNYRVYSLSNNFSSAKHEGAAPYTESGLQQDISYDYRIYTLNGDGVESSDYSTASTSITVETDSNTLTWTTKGDFENNAGTTGQVTDRSNVTVSDPGDVRLTNAVDKGTGAQGNIVIDGTHNINEYISGYNPDTGIIPNFNNLTVNGTLTTSPGVRLEFKVKETLTVNGYVDASSCGYSAGTGPGAGGAGGSAYYEATAGGGGAGYSTAGQRGFDATYTSGGAGGNTYSDFPAFGSGGGNGGDYFDDNGSSNLSGGAGGGAIKIQANSIVINGQIRANGANGTSSSTYDYHGAGGGGSGGSVTIISGTTTVNSSNIYVNGGLGGLGSPYSYYGAAGGSGGLGRTLLIGPAYGSIGGESSSVGLRYDSGAGVRQKWSLLLYKAASLVEGQAIKFAIKTSNDGLNWSGPFGRDGAPIDWTSSTGNYFGQAYGDTAPYTIISGIQYSRFVDVVVRLEGNNGTPTLNEVTLNGPRPPSNLAIDSITKDSADLSWDDEAVNETAYKVEKSTDGTSFTQVATLPPNTTSYTVGSLNSNTRYWFRVSCSRTTNSSDYAQVGPKYTLTDVAQNPTAVPESDTSIKVEWQAPATGTVTNYKVYSSSDNYLDAKHNDPSRSYIEPGLTAGTYYVYRIYSVNGDGVKNPDYVTVIGRISVPSEPLDFSGQPLSKNSIRWTWTGTPDAESYVLHNENNQAPPKYEIWQQTTDTQFNSDTKNNTKVVGTGEPAKVQMDVFGNYTTFNTASGQHIADIPAGNTLRQTFNSGLPFNKITLPAQSWSFVLRKDTYYGAIVYQTENTGTTFSFATQNPGTYVWEAYPWPDGQLFPAYEDSGYLDGQGTYNGQDTLWNGAKFDCMSTIHTIPTNTGTITSTLIQPTNLNKWGYLSFTKNDGTNGGPANSTVKIDVLDSSGTLLKANVASQTDLSTLPELDGITAIKLRADFYSPTDGNNPSLLDWSVDYQTNSSDIVIPRHTDGSQNYSYDLTGLAPNTDYRMHVHAVNSKGRSGPSPEAIVMTYPEDPFVWPLAGTYSKDDQFVFTNNAGNNAFFGIGHLEHYHWIWDQSPTRTQAEIEGSSNPVWSSGTLTTNSTKNGKWYLHLVSHNPLHQGTKADIGPYFYGINPAVAQTPVSYTTTSNAYNVGSLRSQYLKYNSSIWHNGISVMNDQFYFGTSPGISVPGNPPQYYCNLYHGYYSFDFDNIPQGATINSATLTIPNVETDEIDFIYHNLYATDISNYGSLDTSDWGIGGGGNINVNLKNASGNVTQDITSFISNKHAAGDRQLYIKALNPDETLYWDYNYDMYGWADSNATLTINYSATNVAKVTSPGRLNYVRGTVPVIGTAYDENLTKYTLDLFSAAGGSGTRIEEQDYPVTDDTLTSFDTTSVADGKYRIKVDVEEATRRYPTSGYGPYFIIDNTLPQAFLEPLSGPYQTGLITFNGTATDANAGKYEMQYSKPDNPGNWTTFASVANQNVTNNMLGSLNTSKLTNGNYNFRIVVTDKAGNEKVSNVIGSFLTDNPGQQPFDTPNPSWPENLQSGSTNVTGNHYIYEGEPDKSQNYIYNPPLSGINISRINDKAFSSLVYFDIFNIPKNAVIDKAVLKASSFSGVYPDGYAQFDEITRGWDSEETWNSRPNLGRNLGAIYSDPEDFGLEIESNVATGIDITEAAKDWLTTKSDYFGVQISGYAYSDAYSEWQYGWLSVGTPTIELTYHIPKDPPNLPSSVITQPTGGSTLNGTEFTISGTAMANEVYKEGTFPPATNNISKVEVSTDNGLTWHLASGTSNWTYQWVNPPNGSYNIKSRAYDDFGFIELKTYLQGSSTQVTVVNPNAPANPSNLQINPVGTDRLELTWADNADNENYYSVEQSTDGLIFTPVVTDLPADSTSYTALSLNPNTAYYFRVNCYGSGGSSNYVTAGPTYTLADKPRNPTAVPLSGNSIKVDWQAPASGTAYSYNLYSSSNGFSVPIYSGTDRSFTELGLTSGNSYTYRVYSVNEDDVVNPDYIEVTATIAEPSAPTNFSGQALSANSIRWSWMASENASYYLVHDASNNLISLVPANVDGSPDYTFDEISLSPNMNYTRHVHAVNVIGESLASNQISSYTLPETPDVTPGAGTFSQQQFVFTNNAGGHATFGPGHLDHYHWIWDQAQTRTQAEIEGTGNPVWSSGTLTTSSNKAGRWYLHLVAHSTDSSTAVKVDIGPYYYGLDEQTEQTIVNVTEPIENARVQGTVDVKGSAFDLDLTKYIVEIVHEDGAATRLDEKDYPVINGVLTQLNSKNVPDGKYRIHLIVEVLGDRHPIEAYGPYFTIENEASAKNPKSTISNPEDHSYIKGSTYRIEGRAVSNNDDAVVNNVDVSTNGGVDWTQAQLSLSSGAIKIWYYDWALPSDGEYNLQSRATDTSGLIQNPFFQRLLRGSSTYGAMGGTATHTHSYSMSFGAATGTIGTGSGGNGGWAYNVTPEHSHAFSYSGSFSTESSVPLNKSLKVIKYNNGIPDTIPAGAIAIFDSSLPSGWAQYAAQNGYYVMSSASAGVVSGAASHTHSGPSYNVAMHDDAWTTTTGATWTSPFPGFHNYASWNYHWHGQPAMPLTSNNDPSNLSVVLAKANSDIAVPNGLIGIFNGTPQGGWNVVSGAGGDFDGRFIKGSSAYGAKSGTSNTSHSSTWQTTADGGAADMQPGSLQTVSSADHYHDINLTTSSAEPPPFIDVIFAKKTAAGTGSGANMMMLYDGETIPSGWSLATYDDQSVTVTVDNTLPIAEITSPLTGDTILKDVIISGTASDTNLDYYYIEVGEGQTPTSWKKIGTNYTNNVSNGALAEISARHTVGPTTIRLTVVDKAGNQSTSSVFVNATGTNITNPHSAYTEDTELCAYCHGTHTATLPRLLVADPNIATMSDFCYVCHDGSGSKFNIKTLIDDTMSHHPVKDAKWSAYYNADPAKPTVQCTSCHDPHGYKIPGTESYSMKLLAAHDNNGTPDNTSDDEMRYVVPSGPDDPGPSVVKGRLNNNDFCYACHGLHSNKVAGDLTGFELSTHNTADSDGDGTKDLEPASGTKITCMGCHTSTHGEQNAWLTPKKEEQLCFDCHDDLSVGSNPKRATGPKGWNIYQQFNAKKSKHDVFSVTGAKVECVSCHGFCVEPSQEVADPSNTVNRWEGSRTGFCLKCHNGDIPNEAHSRPDATHPNGVIVPYTIKFPEAYTNLFAGFDKSPYPNASHGKSNYTCEKCHHPHGSANDTLIAFNRDDSVAYNEEKLCYQCHKNGGESQNDIQSLMAKTYKHPVETENKHSNKENLGQLQTDRHAECADCHNSHEADDSSATAPSVKGSLKGVSGVDINGKPVKFARYEYEVCFKCHDDIREAFKNANSAHPVVNKGKDKGITHILKRGLTEESQIFCSDCHTNDKEEYVDVKAKLANNPVSIDVSLDGKPDETIAVAANTGNNSYLVIREALNGTYSNGTNPKYSLFARTINADGSMASEQNISSAYPTARFPAVAYNPYNSQYPYVVFYVSRPINYGALMYMARLDASGNFNLASPSNWSMIGGGYFNSLSVTTNTTPSENDKRFLAVFSNPTNSGSSTTIDPNTGKPIKHPYRRIATLNGWLINNDGVPSNNSWPFTIAYEDGAALDYPAVAYNGDNNQYGVAFVRTTYYPCTYETQAKPLPNEGEAKEREIYFYRLNNNGTVISTKVQVGPATVGTKPSVAYNASLNEYLLTWSDTTSGKNTVYAQRLTAAGVKVGSVIEVTNSVSTQDNPKVIAQGDKFKIFWQDDRVNKQPNIYSQTIGAAGAKEGANVRVAGNDGQKQAFPVVASAGGLEAVFWNNSRYGSPQGPHGSDNDKITYSWGKDRDHNSDGYNYADNTETKSVHKLCYKCHEEMAYNWGGSSVSRFLHYSQGPHAPLPCTFCHRPHTSQTNRLGVYNIWSTGYVEWPGTSSSHRVSCDTPVNIPYGAGTYPCHGLGASTTRPFD
ncbi:MAG: hypothetical protein C4562_06095 [Actinobacteria bacterium]|nr:MAG: hypothetical protein C4562_06095 [Actinomycetota bacterium]